MNLYLLYQNEVSGYDTHDSCVVVAEDEDSARLITPCGLPFNDSDYGDWARTPVGVNVKLIGTAVEGMEPGVVLASFNAG